MPIKSFAPRRGLLLVAGLVLAMGNVEASAEERLPWLRDPPSSERTYAQADDVDQRSLPSAEGTEADRYGRSYESSAPRAGSNGYDRRDDVYHPDGRGGTLTSPSPRGYNSDQADYSSRRGDGYQSPPANGRYETYNPPARAPSYDTRSGSNTTNGRDDTYHPPQRIEPYEPSRTYSRDDTYRPPSGREDYSGRPGSQAAAPYSYPPRRSDEPEWRDDRGRPAYADGDRYASAAPPHPDREPPPSDGTYSMREIVDAGHGFFGSISRGLASVIEYAFKTQGRPNGYILGQDAGGAFVAGLRYGEGRLYTRDAGTHRVFWQGPSLGYDAGAEGSKVMVLVYNLRGPSDIYHRFAGVDGSAYVVGGVGVTFQQRGDVVLAPIRAGVGFRLGANVGYLKYTRRPTWNPF